MAIAIVGICWPFGRGRWRAFFGFRHFWTFPPLWVSAAIGLLGIALIESMFSGWEPMLGPIRLIWLDLLLLSGYLAVCAACISVLSQLLNRRGNTPLTVHTKVLTELETLTSWLADDREIETPNEDRFGHDAVASRIACRLTKSSDKRPTIAVVGPLGSGKSTIRALVANRVANTPQFVMRTLSLWPFESPDAAVKGTIQTVQDALGNRVNTLSVSGLSERYLATIDHAAGRWNWATRLFSGESQPEAILNRFDAIVQTAGITLILWIEDLERFTGADRLPPEDAAIREAERLAPILSLLHLLDRCESVSVIVCDISLRSRLDVGKIARFVESPPRLTREAIWEQISLLRSNCLSDEGLIDPASEKYRDTLTYPADDMHRRMWFWSIRDTEPRVQEAVAMLLDTPRAFKAALRITWETWNRLRGEIDFDSVLVSSALRVSRPDMFALIDRHIDQFRAGLSGGSRDKKDKSSVEAEFQSLLDREPNERMQYAVRSMIEFVFPAAFRKGEVRAEFLDRPQGLCINRHADYWKRYLTLPDQILEPSDQRALRSIHDWKNGRESDLIARLKSKDASQIESFVHQFAPKELCRLLRELAEALHCESAHEWGDRNSAPGIYSIARMMGNRPPSSKALLDELVYLVRTHIGDNLPLIECITSTLSAPDNHSMFRFGPEESDAINACVGTAICAAFSGGRAEQLLGAIRNGSPYVLYWLCWGTERLRSGQRNGKPFEEWDKFAQVLVEAAELDPDRGIPLLITFVTDSKRGESEWLEDESGHVGHIHKFVTSFDREAAERLFGTNFIRLLRVLSAAKTPAGDLEELADRINVAQEDASAILRGMTDTDEAA